MSVSIKKITACLAGIALTLLTACGGQSTTDTLTTSGATNQTSQTLSSTANGRTNATKLLDSLAVLYPNGQLPANRAAQASQDLSQNPAALKLTAETVTAAEGQNTTNTTKAHVTTQAVAADYQPVQRVQNTTLYGAYFFSIYPTEIATALATNPNWSLEGPAFWASLATGTDLYPVHRFRNKTNGSYLYSIYESERAVIATNYAATFEYEGVAWYARQTPATGWSALYRFRNKTNGTYLFSAFESEKDAIVATYPDVFALEGIAYYVRQDAPDTTAPVITLLGTNPLNLTAGTAYTEAGATCVDDKDPTCTIVTTGSVNTATAGSYIITYTATDAAGNVSSKTRAVTVPTCTAAANASTGYSLVFKGCSVANVAEYYDKTECVRDNATGLIWQGQTPAGTGLRANDQFKTNYDSITELQKDSIGAGVSGVYIAPTQAEVDVGSNSIGFKNSINETNLCGSSAWRLPTQGELLGIVKTTEYPAIDKMWFPNTANLSYWTSSPHPGYVQLAGYVYFYNGGYGGALRDFNGGYLVRLVR